MKTMARSLRNALPVSGWLVLGALCVLAVALALVTNAQYGPDSRIYLAWTYWYLGHPQAEAAQMSFDYLRDNPGLATCITCWPPDFHESFFTGPYAAVVGPRVLLPVLSAPFVALFGPAGMLVVPIVGYALAILATVLLASRLWGPRWALVAGAMLLLPVYVSRWSVVAHTEGPAFALLALPLLVLPLARKVGRKQLISYVALIALGMLNRQFAIALPVAVAGVWLLVAIRDRAFRNPWLSFAVWGNVVAFVVLAAQMLITPLIFGGEDLSLAQRFDELTIKYFGTSGIAAIPEVTENIIRSDLLAVRYDLALVALLVASTVAVVWRFRSEISGLAAGAFFVVSAFNVIEFWPAAFRYHAPVVPLLVLAVVALMVDLWGPIRRLPSRSTEAEPREPVPLEHRARRWLPKTWLGRMPAHAWVTVASLAVLVPAVLSYRIWHFYSSSMYHLAWSYRILGFTPGEAAERTYAELYDKPFAATNCGRDSCFGQGSDWLFAHASSADPNLVYPVLSAPFVGALGDRGLIVVPLLSFFAAVGMLTYFAAKRWGALAGTVTAVVFGICDRIVATSLTGTADMFALALCCALLFTLPLGSRRGRRTLVVFAVLTALLLASRAPATAFVAAVASAWVFTAWRERTLRNAWLPYVAVASGLAVALVALGQVAPIADARYLGSLGELVRGGVDVGALLRTDGAYLAEDAVLCSVLVLALVAAPLRALRDPLAALALGGIVGCVVLEVLGGTPSGARAFSTVFPLILLAAMGMLARLFDQLSPWEVPATLDEKDEEEAEEPEPVPAA
ncbi:glycosyltransferase family 39 protein [Cryptosporangium sp. NPDC048952]|uniref:glycosyltransferase family 39 protein n=1 Tax=Cryptosporangium sp. NPDC048952 TaxID=3363961 RepID=UPI00371AB884